MELPKYNILVVLLGFVCLATAATNSLQEIFSWKIIDYEYPSEEARIEAIWNGEFIPENNIPLGVERWRNKLFVTVPRWSPGTAATVTYINLDAPVDHSPKLKPYPNWEANQIFRNNVFSKIANVLRVHVDVCDRLWLVDAGFINALSTKDVIHPPKIQAYDLHTDRLILEYSLPRAVYKDDSFFSNLIVDVSEDNCNNAYVYLADFVTPSMVVYDVAGNDAWVVSHEFFSFDPLSTDFNIGGNNFQWRDGLIGFALSSPNPDGSRLLYFHAESSTNEFAVSTFALQNKTFITAAPNSEQFRAFNVIGCRDRTSQSIPETYDEKTDVLFYSLVQKDAVACWNTKKPYTKENNVIIASDPITMSFPSDLKVDKHDTLWLLTDRLPTFIYSRLNYDDVNFRIFSTPIDLAINGTACDKIATPGFLFDKSEVPALPFPDWTGGPMRGHHYQAFYQHFG